MDSGEIALFAVALAGVAGVAYAMGKRRPPEPSSSTATGEPTTTDDDDEAPAEPAKAEQTKAEEEEPPKPAAADDIPKLNEEEENDVDVTKVGAAASSAPPASMRKVMLAPVVLITKDERTDSDPPMSTSDLFLVHATAQTDTGLRRKRNEDSLLVLDSSHVFAVADGMGGYRGGEIASRLAVKALSDAFAKNEFEGPPHQSIAPEASELARAIQTANTDILDFSKQKKELEGMGTTLCAVRFSPNKRSLYIGHVGDSRCYRMRNGVFTMLTNDHTMAEHGVTGPESQHLSRALGIWPTVPIDIVTAEPKRQDVYLLCSDGLTKMLNDDLIATVLRGEEDPKAAVERLILFANSRGGKDNITVVLIRVVPPNWTPAPSKSE